MKRYFPTCHDVTRINVDRFREEIRIRESLYRGNSLTLLVTNALDKQRPCDYIYILYLSTLKIKLALRSNRIKKYTNIHVIDHRIGHILDRLGRAIKYISIICQLFVAE